MTVAVLDDLFATTSAEHRAALIGYLPAGFPDVAGIGRRCCAR